MKHTTISTGGLPSVDLLQKAELIFSIPALVELLQSGAVRELYPEHVAESVIDLIIENAENIISQGSK